MRRFAPLLAALAALAFAAGCAGRGPANGDRAAALAAWLDEQPYSTWSTFRRASGPQQSPPSPDGLTLGSPNIFAAVGCNDEDLSSLDVFWADRRTVRPLARQLTLAVQKDKGAESTPLAAFPEQTLRRVRHTAIAVGESMSDGLSVTVVDFAPMDPAQNFLARWFLVENTGEERVHVDLVLRTLAPGEWTRLSGRSLQSGDGFAIVADVDLEPSENEITARLGRLSSGDRAAGALLLVGADGPDRLAESVTAAQAALPDLLTVLEDTCEEWTAWCARTPLVTGEERTDDLLDSLLCLVRSHVGEEAIHTGSVRYPHDRAWIRDSYWAQRALLEIGRPEEALVNLGFFHRAWRESGIASYYEVATLGSTAYGYHGVELPHYLVLMVRDAERLAGMDGADYWDMVKGCLDEAAVPPYGLQPMNGDETWLLAAPVRELDALLDNTWLLIASADYGLELAGRVGDADSEKRYRSLASQARGALFRFQPRLGEAEWYAVGRGGGGSLDVSLCPGVLARGAVLDVLPAADPYLSAGLITSWNRLSFDRGIRAHSRSATISGGTAGYVLYAAAENPACDFTGELACRMLDFASATGCVWEFHDLHDPAWGGEKRRLWDSAVLLMGLVHALFESRETEEGIEFQPKTDLPTPSAPPEPPFEAEELLAHAGPALVLHDGSEQHAARIARELLRHRNEQFAISQHRGAPADDHSAIVISRQYPPTGWQRTLRGYWVRNWEGPPQLWVRNTDHPHADTDLLLTDLLSLLVPQRETPLPFPDANYDLVSRFGEMPSGEARVLPLSQMTTWAESAPLDLSGGEAVVETDGCRVKAKAAVDRERRLLTLTLSADAAGPSSARIVVRLPAGWWVVYARDMTGRWDRIQTPVSELRLPTGGTDLLYTFPPSEAPVHLTFDLARLPVKSL